MISAVHRGAHQVAGAGIQPDILLKRVLLMDCRRHQRAVGREHIAPQLGVDLDVGHARGRKNLLIDAAHAVSDTHDVVGLLIGIIRDADTAGQVDKIDPDAKLVRKVARDGKQLARQRRIIFLRRGVAGQKGMDTEFLHASVAQNAEAFKELLRRKAVFGVGRIVHNRVADGETAGVITAADFFRQTGQLVQKIDMREVVKVDGRAQLARIEIILRRSGV